MRKRVSQLGVAVRKWRHSRGWTQQYVADRLGLTNSAVAQWELGTSTPSGQTMEKLAKVFGLSLAEFVTGPVRGSSLVARWHHVSAVGLMTAGLVPTACGKQWLNSLSCSSDWAEVTCKACLKRRPGK